MRWAKYRENDCVRRDYSLPCRSWKCGQTFSNLVKYLPLLRHSFAILPAEIVLECGTKCGSQVLGKCNCKSKARKQVQESLAAHIREVLQLITISE
jgi:hypothetical protein